MMSEGGYVTGPPVRITLADDECVFGRDLRCKRTDDRHHYAMVEAPRQMCQAEPSWIRGRCLHRHVEPVTSVSGELVARLCLACDAQLPA